MGTTFLDRLNREVLLADGAMGTLLLARGIEPKALMEQNLTNPDLIRQIHLDYIRAGAQLIETNTFLANRLRLAEYGLESELEAINRAAVRIAREAVRMSGEEVFIAGSVGPLGALVKPYGNLTLDDLSAAYVEQIAILVDEGVDVIIIETHPSLLEALEAVRAAKTVSPTTPIIAQMTFLEDGKSKFGDDLRRSLEALAAADADVVGVNCSGPQMTYDIIYEFLTTTELPVSIMPNAGVPQFIGGRTIYLSSPEYLREYARRFVEAGANILGGCCGTTPEHIRAMGVVVRGQVPRRVRQRVAVSVGVREELTTASSAVLPARFRERLGREFVVVVEVHPPRGVDYRTPIEHIRRLAQCGVDAVSVHDPPEARVSLSSFVFAHVIQTQAGVEAIWHLSCRDRTLAAIHSELLGAAVLGVRNVLALTGEAASVGEWPRWPSAHDVSATGLVKIIEGLNRGRTLTGNDIGSPTDFRVGVLAQVGAEDVEAEFRKLEERVEAGAHFIVTTPVFDLPRFEWFWKRCLAFGLPILVGILPLKSARHAEFLHHEVPGITIPEVLRERLRRAQENESAEGMRIARELIAQLRPHVAGVYLIPPSERWEALPDMLVACLPEAQRTDALGA
ncbi:MAG: bifunctional homocysteine S-methyltransferase/methylenetetrahydrofolate reductase [Blastocatellia bacterium]|nr:bifunctional homocysteine S-methyltransferase/methylenetetrahydrofolate reductase [Blastocatellia bacterium]MCS7158267.1 bifunctional homocysteine S-methyltransferase/methylenetetrahydrofolate reductase [Blastocatellia bacterium]MCX7753105.1 bifunctional homocysteine S-methyltransferase/methylenetetrahydrofolate reductase [Blastocatellia bacterium]MDW8169419.1 bifunctional homocysteine S-methyltransferase/methylenetetrahydrofolate reductase [Acidobacteriota bacterium]MDW8255694.1 bifunctiona